MPTITSIKQQAKRQDRYSIYVDGKYFCSFSENELLKLGLRIGQELTEQELESLKGDAMRDKARMSALGQLSRRPRSEWEIADYLRRKGHSQEVIGSTVEHLRELGYINDTNFARLWVENRRLLKTTSKRRLKQELRQKRVPDEIITETLQEDETDERDELRQLIERKRRQSRYKDDLKLTQYLIRQGFNYEDIKSAMEETENA